MEQKHKNPAIFTIPNLLSCFRLCLIPVIVWLYCVEKNTSMTGYMLLLSGLTDIADGLIARKFNMVSDLGKVLDPIADKLTQAVMLLCLVLRYPLMLLPLLLMVAKEVFMGISGILVIKRTGIVLGANWHGKAATVMLYATMFLHVFWAEIPPALSHLTIFCCCGIIALSFVLYGLRNLEILCKRKGAPYGKAI